MSDLTEDEMQEIARGNIARHLGNTTAADYVDNESETAADAIYSDTYVLAFNALRDRGIDDETARRVANDVARTYIQPL